MNDENDINTSSRILESQSTLNEGTREKVCSYDFVKKRIPILAWLPVYSFASLGQDILAGITVGLTAIPQGIAYAEVAGLDVQYGLYSGFMGGFVYAIFGSCKDLTIGPTAIMSLMIQPDVANLGPDGSTLLCFFAGCIIFLLGVLNLGFLIQFISFPVSCGFTTAAAISIGSTQLKSLLGLSGSSNGFLNSWIFAIENIMDTRWQDLTLGICSICLLLILRYFKKFGHRRADPNKTKFQNFTAISLWLSGIGSNAIVVLIGTVLAWVFSIYGLQPFIITKNVKSGLPPFELPPFHTTFNNQTYNFVDMSKEMGIRIISVPLIGILESFAISRSFAEGKTLDATQELLSLGLANLMGSFVSSMPSTGSFTRTTVNNASGVQTPLGGIFNGALVLFALTFLTSYFYFIPKATLAAVIITAMFFMMNLQVAVVLWKTKKVDLFIYIATTLLCLFISLEIGICLGIAINIVFVLYLNARPLVAIEKIMNDNNIVLVVRPSQSLQFMAAEYVREQVMIECDKMALSNVSEPIIVVIDGKNIINIDATVATNFDALANDLHQRKIQIIFWRWSKSSELVCRGLDSHLSEIFVQADSLEMAIRAWQAIIVTEVGSRL